MKKNILLLLPLLILGLFLNGCSNNGLSAYEIAVKNGFNGSEVEWLESLKGKDGTSFNNQSIFNITSEETINGHKYTITYSDSSSYSFEVNDGQNAYEIAKDHGFIGDEESWLNSLTVVNYNTTINSSDGVINGINKAILSTVAIVAKDDADSETGSSGAGVIIDLNKATNEAYIITNYHVVYDDTNQKISPYIGVYLYGQESKSRVMEASYIGGSLNYDIAIIKVTSLSISSSFATAATISNELEVGQTTIAVGNPEGTGISASVGILNLESEYITLTGGDNITSIELRVMRTDAAVNPGNSGGGLFNKNGELIGIVNAKSIKSTSDNIGYAIPIYNALSCYNNILDIASKDINKDGIYKPLLGITIQAYDKESSYDPLTNKFTKIEHIKVIEINDTSICKNIVEVDDILNSISCYDSSTLVFTKQINHIYDITEALINVREGNVLVLNITRAEETFNVNITITSDSINLFI